MSKAQRWVIIMGMIALAILLPCLFLKVRSTPMTAENFLDDANPEGLVVQFRVLNTKPNSVEGLYTRIGITPIEGILGGVVVPIILGVSAIYFLVGFCNKPK